MNPYDKLESLVPQLLTQAAKFVPQEQIEGDKYEIVHGELVLACESIVQLLSNKRDTLDAEGLKIAQEALDCIMALKADGSSVPRGFSIDDFLKK